MPSARDFLLGTSQQADVPTETASALERTARGIGRALTTELGRVASRSLIGSLGVGQRVGGALARRIGFNVPTDDELKAASEQRLSGFEDWWNKEHGGMFGRGGWAYIDEAKGAPVTRPQKIANVVAERAAPQIAAAIALPIPVKGLSLGPRIFAESARGAIIGSQTGEPLDSAKSAAMFGAMGGISGIGPSSVKGLIGRTAAQAALPYAEEAIVAPIENRSPDWEQASVNAAVMAGLGAITDKSGAVKRLFRRNAAQNVQPPPEQLGPPSPYEVAPEGYSTPFPPPRELTAIEIAQRANRARNIAPPPEPSATGLKISRSAEPLQPPVEQIPVEPTELRLAQAKYTPPPEPAPPARTLLRSRFAPSDQALYTAPVGEGDVFANAIRKTPLPPAPGSIGYADKERLPVIFEGMTGKIRVRNDGTYFRPSGTNKEIRIFASDPYRSLAEIEGLSLATKTKRLLRKHAETSPAAPPEPTSTPGKSQTSPSPAGPVGEPSAQSDWRGRVALPLGRPIAGGILGGIMPAEDDEQRAHQMAMGALAGLASYGLKPGAMKPLMRRAAAATEQRLGRTLKNRAARAVVDWTRLGEEQSALTASQSGKGFNQLLGEQVERAQKGVTREMLDAVASNPAQRAAVYAFNRTPLTPASESALRRNVPKEMADALVVGKRAGTAVQSEGELAEGPGTERGRMFRKTKGTYATESYSIFEHPERWREGPGKDAALFNRVLTQLQSSHPQTSREELRRDLDRYLSDLQTGKETFGVSSGNRVSQHLYTSRKAMSPEFKQLLGHITDPVEIATLTTRKLLGQSAMFRYINELDNATAERGTKLLMTHPEMEAARAAGKDVSDYVKISDSAGLGKIAGKYAPVSVASSLNRQMAIEEKFFRGVTGKILKRGMSVQKAVVTVGNWATHARQWLQTPLFVIASRGDPRLLPKAWKALRNPSDPIWAELRENNIVGANFSSGEFNRYIHQMGVKQGALSKGWQLAKKIYGMPDDIVRALSYITAKRRFGGDIRKAVEHVNRFTMNYGAQSRLVNLAKNLPFVNPFISFLSEMMRVSKNLADEAINGATVADRAWAMAGLAGIFGAGKIASEFTRSLMTPDEKKEFDQMEKLMPSWQRYQAKANLSGLREMAGLSRKNQAGGTDFIGLNTLTPAGDLYGLAKALSKGDWEAVVKENPMVGTHKNPFIAAIMDIAYEKHRFTQAPIEGEMAKLSRLSEAFLPPIAGWESESGQSFGGYSGKKIGKLYQHGGEWEDPRSGRLDTIPRTLLREGAGINIQSAKRSSLLRTSAYQRDKALREAASEANVDHRTANTDEQHKAISKRLMRRQKSIREEFAEKTR